jgi:spermidine/putrescine transport system substrate-binding protein
MKLLKRNEMNSRILCKLFTCQLLVLLILGISVINAAEIRVLNWQGYGTDETWALVMFKERTGIDVVHDYFNSEQEMLTKLRTNPGVYDVVLINSAYTNQAANEGLIEAIDTTKMVNVPDLSPGMRNDPKLVMNGKTFGVAWVWGVTSFAIDTTDFNKMPDSIEELWDSSNAGRVGWRDDAVEAVQLAAVALGQDINNPSDLSAIRQKLRALKTQIRTFWSSEDEWNQFFSANEFDLATYWSGSASRSKNTFNLSVEFVLPKEGAIGWLDGLSIPTNAPNLDSAKAFIDFMIDPQFYVKWDTEVGAPISANAKAVSMLPADAFNRTTFSDPRKLTNVQFMGPMDDDLREEIVELWQETKTYFQN